MNRPTGTPGVPKARKTRGLPVFVEKEDWPALIAAARYDAGGQPKSPELAARDQALIALMLYTGLRVAEVAALDLPDLVLIPGGEQVVVRCGKGGKMRRLDLHRVPRAYLEKWLERRWVCNEGECEPLFVSLYRRRISHDAIQRAVTTAAQATGRTDVTAHCLRHSFAVRLWEKSEGNLFLVMNALGHSDPATTMIYAQVRDAARRKATMKL